MTLSVMIESIVSLLVCTENHGHGKCLSNFARREDILTLRRVVASGAIGIVGSLSGEDQLAFRKKTNWPKTCL